MYKFLTLFILIPALTLGQVTSVPTPSGNDKQQLKDTTPDFVILPICKNLVFDKTYKASTLSPKEIVIVRDMLKRKLLEGGTEGSKFEKYKLQFIAAINPAGDKVIFVNSFCNAPSKWQKELVFVEDGGDCYYQATINLRKRQFLSFRFNGEA